MRHLLFARGAWLLALTVACAARSPQPAGPPPPPVDLAITHVTVIDPGAGRETADRTVLVSGERIVGVVAGDAVAPARATVDGRGKYLIPGLWDMHVHFADPGAARLFIANGVTGVRVMWGNPRFAPGMERFHFQLREAFDGKRQVGPRMVIASQILDGPKPIWPNSVALATAEEGRRAVDEARASGVDFIKVYSLLPRAVFLAIAEESKKVGLPFAGHVPEAVGVVDASQAGMKSIEHLTGVALGCSSREPELREARVAFAARQPPPTAAEWSVFRRQQRGQAAGSFDAGRARALFATFVAQGTWQCPTLTVLRNSGRLDDPSLASDVRLQYVPPFVKTMWDPRRDFRTRNLTADDYAALRATFDKQLALVGALDRAGVPLLAGTDELNPYCFPGFSLHDELGLLVQAGLSPLQALRAATSSPARFLARDDLGAIAAGKLADLVLLEGDPLADIANTRRITAVVSRGTLHDRPALDRLLAEARAAASAGR
jgi:imidazolonepropionase-like amidohydrolase